MALVSSLAVEPLIPAITCTPNLLPSAEGAFIKMVWNAVNQPHGPCWRRQRDPWFRARANVQESSTHSMLRRNWAFAAKAHDEYILRRSTQYAKTLQLINRGRIKAAYVSEKMVVSKQG